MRKLSFIKQLWIQLKMLRLKQTLTTSWMLSNSGQSNRSLNCLSRVSLRSLVQLKALRLSFLTTLISKRANLLSFRQAISSCARGSLLLIELTQACMMCTRSQVSRQVLIHFSESLCKAWFRNRIQQALWTTSISLKSILTKKRRMMSRHVVYRLHREE